MNHASLIVKHLVVGLMFVVVSRAGAEIPPPSEATQAFLDERPNVVGLVQGERMVAFFHAPLEANVTAMAPDVFVESFVQNNKSAFGVNDPTLVFKEKHVIDNGRFTVYTYTQEIEGLPVFGSVLKIPFFPTATERIAAANFNLTQPPRSGRPHREDEGRSHALDKTEHAVDLSSDLILAAPVYHARRCLRR
jgi:hypothetical protein